MRCKTARERFSRKARPENPPVPPVLLGSPENTHFKGDFQDPPRLSTSLKGADLVQGFWAVKSTPSYEKCSGFVAWMFNLVDFDDLGSLATF